MLAMQHTSVIIPLNLLQLQLVIDAVGAMRVLEEASIVLRLAPRILHLLLSFQ